MRPPSPGFDALELSVPTVYFSKMYMHTDNNAKKDTTSNQTVGSEQITFAKRRHMCKRPPPRFALSSSYLCTASCAVVCMLHSCAYCTTFRVARVSAANAPYNAHTLKHTHTHRCCDIDNEQYPHAPQESARVPPSLTTDNHNIAGTGAPETVGARCAYVLVHGSL